MRSKPVQKPIRRVREVLPALIVLAILLTARSSFADHYYVPSGSMLPSLEAGDRIAVDKRAYGLRVPLTHVRVLDESPPRRGDVVVFPSPETGDVLVKRVVAIGGDVVEVREGRVAIDGEPVRLRREGGLVVELLGESRHAVRFDGGGGPDFGPARVPADHVLVLGDNRGNSHDGRLFGFLPNDRLLGRVVGV
ncbi:MAG: signal peptidase I, partial [Myxococcota bacterium]